jgi:putative membrane protein
MTAGYDSGNGPGGGAAAGPEDPRVRFAAERTLLAWVRTALGLMGFGFVVARFGLFLREIEAVRQAPAPHATGWSLVIGVALVLLGVAVTLLAAWQHSRFLARLGRGQPFQAARWSMGGMVAVVLALLGTALAAYLLGVGR